ncbi:hypothetical protein IGI04_014471 [Brassica rapa subsp. trilocularis]|uniref:Uncharacterized protein n=1 Tax=Brassica rapa subsp. trilocularis TaxID=1813537 RepID=A0ABQ7MMB3_BRACM|nr:hypothetical protein IGI04_014471 [Brassica rapa subsp. trilocularis]
MTDQRNRRERSWNRLPRAAGEKGDLNLETHGSYSFRNPISYDLHKESQSRTRLLTQEVLPRQHEEGPKPAMTSFGKDN